MPKKIDPRVEGVILELSESGMTQRSIVARLKRDNIVTSQRSVSNVLNGIGKRRGLKIRGLPSPVKVQPSPVANPGIVRKIDLMTRRENPSGQRHISRALKVSQSTVCRVIKGLRKRNKQNNDGYADTSALEPPPSPAKKPRENTSPFALVSIPADSIKQEIMENYYNENSDSEMPEPEVEDIKYVIDKGSVPEEYFQSYEDLDVHRLMLQDKVRTNAYMDAIYKSKDLFNGKTVMDVGAGTGILSLFCAKAGAKKVYAVEASNLALILPKTIEKNGFSKIIEVIHSKVEDVTLAGDEKVDILVSEWMGFYLLHESLLDSVIRARDMFLKPETGRMFPNTAQIFAATCTLPELWQDQSQFWLDNPYGFDFSSISEIAKLKSKPEIYNVPGDALLSDPQLLWDLNLETVDLQSLQKLSDRRFFTIEGDGEMHGVCVWFVCTFPTEVPESEEALTLSTAPWDPETHWKQTVILFPNSVSVEDGDILGWNFTMEKESLESSSRSYRLHLEMLDESEEHPTPCLCGSVKCEIVRHYLRENAEAGSEDQNSEIKVETE